MMLITDQVLTANSKVVISKLLVITDGCRFRSFKEIDNNKQAYIIHVGSHFSLDSTAQTKLFAISRILARNVRKSAES